MASFMSPTAHIHLPTSQIQHRTVSVSPIPSHQHASLSISRSRSRFPSHSAITLRHGTFHADLTYFRAERSRKASFLTLCTDGGDRDDNLGGGKGHGGGGGDGGGDGEEDDDKKKNFEEAMAALKAFGKTTLPADLDEAVRRGVIPGSVVQRYCEMDKSAFMQWLLQFPGFKERLLADDLFLAKIAMECGVGIFTKTAAELEKRKENFFKEIDFVIADIVMAIVADFMLVWLPAPTIPLRGSLGVNSGMVAKLFHGCPDNAFQVALTGTSYSFLQRVGAIVCNGGKLFLVGTTASLVGTGATNLLIAARKLMYEVYNGHSEVSIVSTSLAYGAYMAISSNLRYQILAGVVEQRFLEPMLHKQKLLLSILCFAARTGNTYLGSLMWVDYARWIGVQ